MTDLVKKVGIELAVSVCPGCVYLENKVSKEMICSNEKPCSMYHIDNFYYDNDYHRFLCKNWLGYEKGYWHN